MKYHINIDYSERSIQDETAKLTLTDENGKKILNKVPVSLPNELFDNKKVGFYYDINNVLPKVSKIDFKTNSFRDLFESNPSFKPLYDLVDENNFYETFNHNNDEYITYKRQVLFFPQQDDSLLGIDNTAFILHEKDFKKLTEALSQASNLTFNVKSARFAIFNKNEKREFKKTSDINKAYTVLKEVLRHERMGNNKESIVQTRIKEFVKNKNNTQPEDLKIEIPEINIDGNINSKEINIQKDIEHAILEKELRKNNKNDLSGLTEKPIIEKPINKMDDRLNKGRGFDIMFMLALYNYFTLQKMSFNKEMIKNVLPKIPGGENIKNFAFVSNEAGFFASLYSDINKKDPIGAISFDYENQKIMLKNEESEINLFPSSDNERILNLTANYLDRDIDMKLLNFDNNKGNNIDQFYTLGQFNVKEKHNNPEGNVQSQSWAVKYNFEYQDDGFPILSYKKNERKEVIDIDLIYQTEKENSGSLINSKLTTLNLDFEGRNDELFKLNKEKVISNLNTEDLISEDSQTDRDYYKKDQNSTEIKNDSVSVSPEQNQNDNKENQELNKKQEREREIELEVEQKIIEEENKQKIQLAIFAAAEKLKNKEKIVEDTVQIPENVSPTIDSKNDIEGEDKIHKEELKIEEKEEIIITNPLLTALIQEKAKILEKKILDGDNEENLTHKDSNPISNSFFEQKQELPNVAFDPDSTAPLVFNDPQENLSKQVSQEVYEEKTINQIPEEDLIKLSKIEQEHNNFNDNPVHTFTDSFSDDFSGGLFDEPQPDLTNSTIYDPQSYESSFPMPVENQYVHDQYMSDQYMGNNQHDDYSSSNQFQEDYQRMERERMEREEIERQNRERELEQERQNNSHSGYRPF